MKKRAAKKDNCSKENLALLGALESYNNYINNKLKTIEDFDVWYEEEYRTDFPKCWYTVIRSGKL